jgi:alcohol dehydrogenase class IV
MIINLKMTNDVTKISKKAKWFSINRGTSLQLENDLYSFNKTKSILNHQLTHTMGKKTSPSHTISTINIKITTKIISFNANHQHQRIVQNDLLISVDGNMDQSNKDRSNTLAQLRNVVNDVNVVTQSDKCVNFLTETERIPLPWVLSLGFLQWNITENPSTTPSLTAATVTTDQQSILLDSRTNIMLN